MDLTLSIAWLACGIVVGLVASLLFGPLYSRRLAARAKLELAQSQQRRALERLRASHEELVQQMEAAEKRQQQALATMKRTHVAQLRAMAEESNRLLARQHDPGDNVISGTSFEVTQFSDER